MSKPNNAGSALAEARWSKSSADRTVTLVPCPPSPPKGVPYDASIHGCGAATGERCRSASGKIYSRGHAPRRAAYAAQKEEAARIIQELVIRVQGHDQCIDGGADVVKDQTEPV